MKMGAENYGSFEIIYKKLTFLFKSVKKLHQLKFHILTRFRILH